MLIPSPRRRLLITLLSFSTPWLLPAQDGTWINATSNSSWGNTANWSDGLIAQGINAVANFSTLDLTANRTVNLAADRTVGTLIFGDALTPSNNWIIANGNGGPWTLTLATSVEKPLIEVINQIATISAILGGTQGFTKTGSGTLTLNNPANTFTGGITLNAGTINFAANALDDNTLTFAANATLGWTAGNTQDISAQIMLSDGVTATLATGANAVVFTSTLNTGPEGSASVTKTGAGNLTLTAAQTYLGTTRVNNGRLILSGGDDRLAASSRVTLGQGTNSGLLQLGDSTGPSHQTLSAITMAGTGTANAIVGGHETFSNLTINNTTAVTYAGKLGGEGSSENQLILVKDGSAALTLTNAGNSFGGDVWIVGGTLAITRSGALGTAAKTVYISGNTSAPTLKLDGSTEDIHLPASISLVTSNDNTTNPALLSNAGNNTVAGSIALTSGGFGNGQTRLKVTAGSLTLSGNLTPSEDAAGPTTAILDASLGATGRVPGSIADLGALTVSITKAGTGIWELAGDNSFTGGVTINAGTLQITRIGSAGTAQPLGTANTAILLGSGTTTGTLEYTGTQDATLTRGITSASAGGGIVRNSGGAVLTLSGTQAKNGRPLTYSGGTFLITGRITGVNPGDLILDTARVTLSNNTNNYTGSTLVQNGSTLIVANTSGSATGTSSVFVDASSTLKGTGLIQTGADASIIIQGKLIVGEALGQTAALLSLQASPESQLVFEANSVVWLNLFAHQTADRLALAGSVVIAQGATLKLTGSAFGVAGDSFQLFDWAGLTGLSGQFTLDASGLDLPPGYALDISQLYDSGYITLTTSVVPEPHRLFMILAGGLLTLFRRRRS
ncbi:PEP-CTERM protein-sorting domain-containing protein [Prosthecobacter debontii]|uniref:PEP-CTERM protein-sorting domain-containing protein n=1 Tax=Prosthecobacter debontii TaxID=48467 RepID=A0A1T4Y5Z8_9BACT|nr:autotransporter-associated beta strand repeat-containing protein [Prosthecobacter debontii]SKA97140.1 PEP-CTERM protein-sorting domain-containing protein [Prosthecobacter debontii]